ncbi:MAG: PTS lactose transporter subunit IIB [Acidimicrobiales bacterium]
MSDAVVKKADEVKLIVFACEAGMGSSLMGANQLKKMVKKAKLEIDVIHSPVGQVPEHADVIVTHKSLAAQARTRFPNAAIVPFMMFFGDPAVKNLVETLKQGNDVESAL